MAYLALLCSKMKFVFNFTGKRQKVQKIFLSSKSSIFIAVFMEKRNFSNPSRIGQDTAYLALLAGRAGSTVVREKNIFLRK